MAEVLRSMPLLTILLYRLPLPMSALEEPPLTPGIMNESDSPMP